MDQRAWLPCLLMGCRREVLQNPDLIDPPTMLLICQFRFRELSQWDRDGVAVIYIHMAW